MSSMTVQDRTTEHVDAPSTGDQWRGMVALARIEAVRLLRHPVTIVAVALFVVPWLYGWLTSGTRWYPVLQDEDRGMQFAALLLLGGAALIVANLAVLRGHRHGTTALYDVLVLPGSWRTGGFLLALVPFGVVSAGLVAVRIGLLAAAPGAAGTVNPYELAATPVAVLLLGAVGVLLARLVRSVVVAPLVLVGLGVATFAGAMPGSIRLEWLLPAAVSADPMPLPVDLMARPAAWHLGYLVGMLALVAMAAFARTGARGWRLAAGTAAGLAVTLAAGTAQFLPASDAVRSGRIAATDRPAERQTCQQIDQVTYCAFAGFTPWVDGWDTVVRGVLRRVPATEAQQPFAVRQRVWAHNHPSGDGYVVSAEELRARAEAWQRADRAAGTPNVVTVGTTWGDGRSEVGLAGLVAYEILTRTGAGVHGTACGARGVLVAWLAGQATPETAAGLREVDATSWGAVSFNEPSFSMGVSVPDREMVVALALLKRPADEVGAIVLRSWAELSAADTPTDRVGEIFGVPVPPQQAEEERMACSA